MSMNYVLARNKPDANPTSREGARRAEEEEVEFTSVTVYSTSKLPRPIEVVIEVAARSSAFGLSK